MTTHDALELIKLLSAIESWSLSHGNTLPDYLYDKLDRLMSKLEGIVLEGPRDAG